MLVIQLQIQVTQSVVQLQDEIFCVHMKNGVLAAPPCNLCGICCPLARQIFHPDFLNSLQIFDRYVLLFFGKIARPKSTVTSQQSATTN